jgi:membrane associated rhomboid family serine protease
MANIHTFSDLERRDSSRPNAQPLPNPWTRPTSQPSSTPGGESEDYYTQGSYGYSEYAGVPAPQQQQQYLVKIPGIDGYETQVAVNPYDATSYLQVACCGPCCPCFIGPPCSSEKRTAYLNLMKSFCFVISFVQTIMLIVALGMGGVVSPSENPSIGPGGSTLDDLGAKDGPKITDHFQFWRFITPIFLHAGIIHLLFNLFFQLRFALFLERQWGLVCFVVIYFVAGIGGNLLSAVIFYHGISVGASTALMGVLGAHCAQLLLQWKTLDPALRRTTVYPTLLMIVFILVFSWLGSKFIDGAGHTGGLICGFLLGALFLSHNWHEQRHRVWISAISLFLLVGYFVLLFVILFTVRA